MNRAAADLVLLLHLAFILFALGGGLLAWRWRRLVWLHLPAALWAALVELFGWICPLTPLENRFRRAAGAGAYEEGFVEHYVGRIVYPEGLTRQTMILLGLAVIGVNVIAYAGVLARRGRRSKTGPG